MIQSIFCKGIEMHKAHKQGFLHQFDLLVQVYSKKKITMSLRDAQEQCLLHVDKFACSTILIGTPSSFSTRRFKRKMFCFVVYMYTVEAKFNRGKRWYMYIIYIYIFPTLSRKPRSSTHMIMAQGRLACMQ